MNIHRCLAVIVALLAALAAPACHMLDPQPDPTQFYVLTPMGDPPQSMVATAKSAITIGLGPVNLPRYLEQPWMVMRGESNRLYVSAHDQWGEPLRNSFKDVLKQDLSFELSDDEIVDYPWYRTTLVDCQIIVDVINFEVDTSTNTANIRAQWEVVNSRNGRTQARGQFVAAQSVGQPSGLDRSAALSKLVSGLAQTLASQVRRGPTLVRGGPAAASRQVAFGR
ncbi:MAG TPA: PqiC family protein [Candidatus Binataceae bacterium]|nr:PqiC family protein [Candidatus Binataceae bacterium]